MEYFGEAFAQVYDRYFGGFAQSVQEPLLGLLETRRHDGLPPEILDLCCGTGHLLRAAVDRSWRGVGVDGSKAMLALAERRLADAIADDRVTLLEADATTFTLRTPVSFAVSTFDALNHLADPEALGRCFRAVRSALRDGGTFVFDLHTVEGIRQTNHVNVRETDEDFFVSRVLHDPVTDRLVARVSGFVRREGEWERFAHSVREFAAPVDQVLDLLQVAGFQAAYPTSLEDLSRPIDDAEGRLRAFFVAVA